MVRVTRICKRTVISTKPVQPGKFHRFSVLDRTMERNHLKAVYYYATPPGKYATGELIRAWRESLSAVLTWYPVVTGRLVRDENGHWMVKCNDAGLRTVEATATGSLEDCLAHLDRGKEIANFIHWEDMFYKPYYWSTFYIQITEFEEGGVAIGLSCTHLLADPTTTAMFMKAWADTTLTGKMASPPFFHPLPPRRPGNRKMGREPYTHLISHYESSRNLSPLTTSGEDIATVSLLFTDAMVRAVMESARGDHDEGVGFSPFEGLSGLFWACISRIRGLKDELMSMAISVDARKVLGLDKGYFGNCVVYNKVVSSEEGAAPHQAAKAISRAVAEMDSEGIMDLVEWLEQKDGQYHPSLDGTELVCADLEGLEESKRAVFDQDAGGGGPVRVSYYLEPFFGEGHVLIMPSTSGGDGAMSRVVMVTLPRDEVTRVCEDELVRSFCPTVVMRS
uniref:Uncharacterized protein n=1 Tax=Kalanchoe fedtschenkoi TaxID=63787 RepID=A0A7N0ZT73_KALFE